MNQPPNKELLPHRPTPSPLCAMPTQAYNLGYRSTPSQPSITPHAQQFLQRRYDERKMPRQQQLPAPVQPQLPAVVVALPPTPTPARIKMTARRGRPLGHVPNYAGRSMRPVHHALPQSDDDDD